MDLFLRDTTLEDLPILFEHQRDPVANEMAVFPARDWDAYVAHDAKIRADPTAIRRTVVVDGEVVGAIWCWGEEERDVGYWYDRAVWGRGIATAALAAFLDWSRSARCSRTWWSPTSAPRRSWSAAASSRSAARPPTSKRSSTGCPDHPPGMNDDELEAFDAAGDVALGDEAQPRRVELQHHHLRFEAVPLERADHVGEAAVRHGALGEPLRDPRLVLGFVLEVLLSVGVGRAWVRPA